MEKIGFKEKAGYGFGDMANNFVWTIVSTYLLFFYTEIFGITAMAAGTMFMVVRIWDAVNDPIMGSIGDRTRTRWGSYRPYILWMALPMGVVSVLCFTSPNFGMMGKLIYAYITYTLLGMVYTAINIPYGAMTSVITQDTDQRTTLSTFRMLGGFIAVIMVNALTLPLVEAFGKGNDKTGYQSVMILFSVVSLILYILCFAWTKERIKVEKSEKYTIKQFAGVFKGNLPLLSISLAFFFVQAALTIRGALGLYYFTYYLNRQDLFPLYSVLGVVPGLAVLVFTPMISKRMGKRSTAILGSVFFILNGVFLFLAKTDMTLVFIGTLTGAVGFGLVVPIVWSMLADTIEYGEWKSGVRAAGLVFSTGSFAQKLATAVGGLAGGLILTAIRYVPGVEIQSPAAQQGIYFWYAFLAVLYGVLAIGILLFYRLDKKLFNKILGELEQRKRVQSLKNIAGSEIRDDSAVIGGRTDIVF